MATCHTGGVSGTRRGRTDDDELRQGIRVQPRAPRETVGPVDAPAAARRSVVPTPERDDVSDYSSSRTHSRSHSGSDSGDEVDERAKWYPWYNIPDGAAINVDLGHGYRAHRILGQGTFSKVVQATHTYTDPATRRVVHDEVAVKVFRSQQRYAEAAQDEHQTMLALQTPLLVASSVNHVAREYLVPLRGYFVASIVPPDGGLWTHSCIVMSLAGPNLLSRLKLRGPNGAPYEMSPSERRSILYQILRAVDAMHARGIVHTDVKPENVMYRSLDLSYGNKCVPMSNAVLLGDFGSAVFRCNDLHDADRDRVDEQYRLDDDFLPDIIQTRHYRAPEVLLGADWSFAADVWSIGCIAAELFTGDALFMTHRDDEHVALLERVLGGLHGVRALSHGSRYDAHVRLEAGEPVSRWRADGVLDEREGAFVRSRPLVHDVLGDDELLCDLVLRMLSIDPTQRVSAHEALQHDYFAQVG